MSEDAPGGQPPASRPATRAARLSVIEELLMAHAVTSQQQLMEMLSDEGLDVTQSTLSRDLDELHAVKAHRPDGVVAYVLPQMMSQPLASEPSQGDERVGKPPAPNALAGLVLSAASAGNIVVIHTPSGAAQYLGSVLDGARMPSVLGTIAGDDTVMAVAADEEAARLTARRLLALAAPPRGEAPAIGTEGEGGNDAGTAS